jgi:hypothetical protein
MNKYTELREHPYFQELVQTSKEKIPIVPDYNPEDPLSGERMKALSLKRQGFLLCLQYFTGESHE